jgi:hypothetical protein
MAEQATSSRLDFILAAVFLVSGSVSWWEGSYRSAGTSLMLAAAMAIAGATEGRRGRATSWLIGVIMVVALAWSIYGWVA